MSQDMKKLADSPELGCPDDDEHLGNYQVFIDFLSRNKKKRGKNNKQFYNTNKRRLKNLLQLIFRKKIS